MKFKLKNEILPLLIIAAAIIISAFTYSHLPAQLASHWDFRGQVNGYTSRNFSAIFFPILLIGMYLLFLLMPVIDPRKANYEKFINVYNTFKDMVMTMLLVIYAASVAYNLGYQINISLVISTVLGLMMIGMGLLMKKIKENWFIGIRTPWTLSSPLVWEKTHKVGGWLFIIFGIIIVIAPYLPWPSGIVLFIVGALLATVGSAVYSYVAYYQELKTKK